MGVGVGVRERDSKRWTKGVSKKVGGQTHFDVTQFDVIRFDVTHFDETRRRNEKR